jgi:hypothetical protein
MLPVVSPRDYYRGVESVQHQELLELSPGWGILQQVQHYPVADRACSDIVGCCVPCQSDPF